MHRFVLLLLLLFPICESEQDISDFSPIRLKVDTTIKSKSLELIESLTIEENENLILTDINDADINITSSKLIICDPIKA